MNAMTLQRYKNELILLLSLLFALGAFIYKNSVNNYVLENKVTTEKTISDIKSIENYKKQWANKKMAKKVKIFQNLVEQSKVKSFSKKSFKFNVSYINLTAKELNKITNKLLNMPLQIVLLNIEESSKNKFKMELKCKW